MFESQSNECEPGKGSTSRRQFLTALAKLGVVAPLASQAADLQARYSGKAGVKVARSRRIDVHHHFFPPRYMAEQRERIPSRGRIAVSQLLAWTPDQSLEAMDKYGIATAVAAISTPGVWFGDVRQPDGSPGNGTNTQRSRFGNIRVASVCSQ